MTQIRFYHLTRSRLEEALPRVLVKALERDMRALVVTSSSQMNEALSEAFWSFDMKAFLPHGTEKQGEAEHQPVWISEKFDNVNQANLLVLVDGVEVDAASFSDYEMVCYFFNGLDQDALGSARSYWKSLKEKGHDLSYWQQTDRGAWEQKQ